MKILFVCRANVGRSQMAEALFNKLSKKHKAESAGINPGKWAGRKLSETKFVRICMAEEGINVNEKISKKLTKKMISDADKVIVVGEKEGWPVYLKKSKKVTFWRVDDPAHEDMNLHRARRDEIKKRILKLLKEIEN